MPVDPEYLEQHYSSLSDEGLLEIDRDDLTDEAQRYYDAEFDRRELVEPCEVAPPPFDGPAEIPGRLTGIRKAALIAGIAAVLQLWIGGWNPIRRILDIDPAHQQWWVMAATVLFGLLSVVTPLFHFALYLNKAALPFPRQFRLLALVAALVMCAEVAASLPGCIASFRPTSVLAEGEPWMRSAAYAAFNLLANLTPILLLLTFSRHGDDDSSTRMGVSKPLAMMTRGAVIGWGLWVAFDLIRLLLTPYDYIQFRDYAAQYGGAAPTLAYLVGAAARQLVGATCFFVAPFIVWRSLRPTIPGAH